jgi:tetratricopeptide (TPR) repeat protein
MRSCIAVFYIALFWCSAAALALSQVEGAQSDPDTLYRERADLAKAREATDIWQMRVTANPKDFESAWKLARAMYWLGTHGSPEMRRGALDRGVAAGRQAAALQPLRPEGHFWMAACLGEIADSSGRMKALGLKDDIKKAFETVLRIDPAFQGGSADRALGRWYLKVPGLFGGSRKRSEEHLRKSLEYDPNSTASHFFLAETLLADDRDKEAREELSKVLTTPLNPEWAPEDREFKEKAQALLETMDKRRR